MRQRLVFEVGDDLFDDGVIAMLGLDQRELLGALGDEREVPPASSSIASTAARTALITRTPMEYLRTPMEYCPAGSFEALEDLRVPEPGVGAQQLDTAPALVTRAISSSVKRTIPFCVFADPLLSRICSAARLSARVARSG